MAPVAGEKIGMDRKEMENEAHTAHADFLPGNPSGIKYPASQGLFVHRHRATIARGQKALDILAS